MLYNLVMESVYEAARDNLTVPAIMETSGCEPHYHTHVELICVTGGEIEVNINGDCRVLGRGNVGVAGSLDVHSYKVITPDATSLVLIAPTKYLGGFETLTGKKLIKNHFFRSCAYEEIKTLLEVGKKYVKCNDLVVSGIINSVLGIAAQNLAFWDENAPKVDTFVMRDALTYISENHTEDITLAFLAKRFGYSPNYFSKLFNTYFQRGLKEYVNAVRADHAVELIMSGTDVNEAAYSAGFDCMRTFYRSFKERFNTTPQEYVKAKKREISEKSES